MDKETQLRLERGREYYANREYDKAEPYLLKVAESESGFADVMNMLGIIYHDRGQVALAQEYFEKALRLNPRYTEAALNLSVAYNEQGMYAEAKTVHDHATDFSPRQDNDIEPYARGKLTNMHAKLGHAYLDLQMFDNAIEQYQTALKLSPDFADIHTQLGQLYRDAGQQDQAVKVLETVKEKHPDYTPALISLGVTYFSKGDKKAAKRQWQSIIDKDPENQTAGMYLRMVKQMLAQEEADAEGIHLEVDESTSKKETQTPQEETSFSFEGEQAAVKSVAPAFLDDKKD